MINTAIGISYNAKLSICKLMPVNKDNQTTEEKYQGHLKFTLTANTRIHSKYQILTTGIHSKKIR